MEVSEWISIDEIQDLREIRPQGLQEQLPEILRSDNPVYLGTEYLDWEQD